MHLIKYINNLNAELNPICHLLALVGAHHILHVSRLSVNVYDLISTCYEMGDRFVTFMEAIRNTANKIFSWENQ